MFVNIYRILENAVIEDLLYLFVLQSGGTNPLTLWWN